MLLFIQSFSQNRLVTGKVVDDKGLPVQSVSILVKGTRTGTATDSAGSFAISVGPGATTLIASSINFFTQEVAITSDMTISLKPNIGVLNDVVVVAYGQAVK
jgi:hypothetical protein